MQFLVFPADARDAPSRQRSMRKSIGLVRDGRKIVRNRAIAEQPTFVFDRRVIGRRGD